PICRASARDLPISHHRLRPRSAPAGPLGLGELRRPAAGSGRAARHRAGDLRQVVGDDPPADPAGEARLAVVAAAVEAVVPLQHMDPALGPGREPEPAAEPALPLVLLPLARGPAGLRQDDTSDAPFAGARLVLWRGEPAIPGPQVRRMAEAFLVGVETRDEVRVLQADVVQDGVVADDAAFYLVEQDLAPELGQLARLMSPDVLGVRLEQGEELVRRRHRLALEHPPLSLGNGPVN